MKNQNNIYNGYLSLCYHYIRPERKHDLFPKLLGNQIDEFHKHIRMLKKHYDIISLNDAKNFSYSDFSFRNKKYGMLITFDDGLSEHYLAAQILAEYGIKGVFFIPTCILMDKLPANPTIIHYCLATGSIEDFLKVYYNALEEHKLNTADYNIKFHKGMDDPWKVIDEIKNVFKYSLDYKQSRKVLLFIYEKLLLRRYSDAMKIMHLRPQELREILDMGHSLGVHSHSHISIAATELNKSDFEKEIVMPKKYIEESFNTSVYALSYPFGKKRDCLNFKALISRTEQYALAFTVEKIVNSKVTSPFELGRYMPRSTDNEEGLKKILATITETKGSAICVL